MSVQTITCDYCQKSFDSEHAHTIHSSRFHDDASPTYGNKSYTNEQLLEREYERHDGNVAAVSRTLDCDPTTVAVWCDEYDVGRYASDSDSTESSHDRVCSNGKQTQYEEGGDA